MRALFFIPVLSALSLVFAGCATPPENPQLLQARSLFSSLQEKPESRKLTYLASEKHDTICCFRCGYQYKGVGVCP